MRNKPLSHTATSLIVLGVTIVLIVSVMTGFWRVRQAKHSLYDASGNPVSLHQDKPKTK